jgi:two-component sensor histidine kinase
MRMYRRESRDPVVQTMLDGLIARVIALSSTHTSLYSLSGRRDVPLQDVLSGVIARMRDIHAVAPSLTRTRLDPIAVAAPQAVPLAMALAEALGSLYAAPDLGTQGVDLDLRAEGDEARLTIRGPVTPAFDPAVAEGLAALPRRMLVQFAAQVRGRITTHIHDGRSVIDLTFPLYPA